MCVLVDVKSSTFPPPTSTACFIFYRHLIPSPPSPPPLALFHLPGKDTHRWEMPRELGSGLSMLTRSHNKSPSRKSEWNKETFIFQFIFASSLRWEEWGGKTASGWIVKHFFCFFLLSASSQLLPCCVCDGNKWINQWLLCCCLFSLRFLLVSPRFAGEEALFIYPCV